MNPLRINDRVRLIGSSGVGTVWANPYMHRGKFNVGVTWDASPKWIHSVAVSALVRVNSEPVNVPPEARPYSVGALTSPERRH